MQFIILIFLTFFTNTDHSSQLTEVNDLKILCWNIYMLPAFPMIKGQNKRAHGIVEVLKQNDYDIICFQEAFHKKSKKIIEKGLKTQYPYQVNTIKRGFSLKATSGLWILSKYPIERIAEIEFKEKKGFDGQARKGAVLFQLNSPKKMQLINTHLQSGVGAERNQIRKDQCTQILTELVEKHVNEDLPLFFIGDWNMKANSNFTNESIKQLYNITNSSDEMISKTWPASSYGPGNGPRNYDLIMLRDNQSTITKFECRIPNLKYKWKKGMDDLADHLPVEAIIEWD